LADYRIILSRSAIKEFENLPSNVIERVRAKIRALGSDPRPPGVKKLQGRPDYRVRVGDYRILFTIADDEKVVDINTISHRSDVYE